VVEPPSRRYDIIVRRSTTIFLDYYHHQDHESVIATRKRWEGGREEASILLGVTPCLEK